MSLASLGAVAGGINRGMDMNQRDRLFQENLVDMETRRQNEREDREFQSGQRQYQQGQQKRTVEQQAKDDTFQTESATIPQPGQQKVVATDAGPDQSLQTQSTYARDLAGAYAKKGDPAKARELFKWADENDAKAEGQRALSVLSGLPANSTPYDIASALAPGITNDKSPIGVRNLVKGDDGSVTLDLYNKTTGYSQPHTFKDTKSMQDALLAHYSPEMYNKILERRQAAQEKLSENPIISVPGGFVDKATKKFTPTMVNGDIIGYGADNQPIYGKAAGASGSRGAGTGAGGKVAAPTDAVMKILDDNLGKNDGSPEASQRNSVVRDYAANIVRTDPSIEPATAARIAIDAADKPNLVTPQINAVDGTIAKVYRNPEVAGGRQFALAKGYSTADELAATPEGKKMLQGQVEQMIAKQPESNRPALIAAAFDKSKRDALLQQVASAYNDTPEQSRERQMQLDIINRKLDLISKYGPAPKPAAASAATGASASSVPTRIGGIFGGERYVPPKDSPAGRSAASRERAQQQAQAADAQRQQQTAEFSQQFNADAAKMEPLEFVRKYDSQRMQLSREDAMKLREIEKNIR